MNHNPPMSPRWFTFFVWAAVAASALAWGLKLTVTPPPAPPQTTVVDTDSFARGDLSRLFGAEAPAPMANATPVAAADARFSLVGVVSPRSAKAAAEGLALIAVDGKPAKTFRVGAVVDGENVLQAVQPRGATLGPRGGPSLIALAIAPPAAAATGVLPPPVSLPAAARSVAPQPLPQPPVTPVTPVEPQPQNQPRAGRVNNTLQ